jgi:hypothetical protein
MQIMDLRSTLIDLFSVDAFDFLALMLDSFSTTIINKYGCVKLNVPPPSGGVGIVFSLGKVEIDGKIKVIDRIVIEERRIIITIGGSSNEARVVMNDIIMLIVSFETRHEIRPLSPILEIDESQYTVQLSIDFPRFISGSMAENVPKSISSQTNIAPASMRAIISPVGLRYRIRYQGENDVLRSDSITMVDKYLTIEAREGISLDARIFFASAPVKSEVLLDLLHSFESE